jgi:hypothetical protein
LGTSESGTLQDECVSPETGFKIFQLHSLAPYCSTFQQCLVLLCDSCEEVVC